MVLKNKVTPRKALRGKPDKKAHIRVHKKTMLVRKIDDVHQLCDDYFSDYSNEPSTSNQPPSRLQFTEK